ncbi:thermonuclease family protein [Roseicyclus sp.]|uniref:thermonuclease family protein n=1 Tax=Roseicyclus sp. TaxID=1914329 RepID=UPI0026203F02|nr:thermonuclease family protein [Roseicyclus sp.]
MRGFSFFLRLGLLLGLGLVAFGMDEAEAASTPCAVARVVDGDTVILDCLGAGQFRARLMGFDTPETYRPRCNREALLGQAATRRLRALLDTPAGFSVELGGWDRYERRLITIAINGRDVGETLIAEGLALPYQRGRRPDWCAHLG